MKPDPCSTALLAFRVGSPHLPTSATTLTTDCYADPLGKTVTRWWLDYDNQHCAKRFVAENLIDEFVAPFHNDMRISGRRKRVPERTG